MTFVCIEGARFCNFSLSSHPLPPPRNHVQPTGTLPGIMYSFCHKMPLPDPRFAAMLEMHPVCCLWFASLRFVKSLVLLLRCLYIVNRSMLSDVHSVDTCCTEFEEIRRSSSFCSLVNKSSQILLMSSMSSYGGTFILVAWNPATKFT